MFCLIADRFSRIPFEHRIMYILYASNIARLEEMGSLLDFAPRLTHVQAWIESAPLTREQQQAIAQWKVKE